MANAICSKCNKQCHWDASRGSRLAHLRSPCCNAEMYGMTRGKSQPHTKGQTFGWCYICSRRRIKRNLYRLPDRWFSRFPIEGARGHSLVIDPTVCGYHEVNRYMDKRDWRMAKDCPEAVCCDDHVPDATKMVPDDGHNLPIAGSSLVR